MKVNKKLASVLCLFYLFFTLNHVYATTNLDKPMEYFILSEDFPLKSNFEFVPGHHRLVLIAQLITHQLTAQQKKRFHEIVLIDHFNVEEIVKVMKNRIKAVERVRVIANDDTIFPIVAAVREQLNIPGPKIHALLPFCCKKTAKKRLQASKVAYPPFVPFDYESYAKDPKDYANQVSQLGFPMIIKPTNLAASLEIKKIHTLEEFHTWLLQYKPQTFIKHYGRPISFIFEAFVSTERFDLFHCDSIIQNGKVVFTQVSRNAYPCMEVGASGKNTGSILIPQTIQHYQPLYALPISVIDAFKRFAPIPNGVMHLEAFRDRNSGQILFLETQLRAPGGQICPSYQYALGIDLVEMDYRLQMELPISIEPKEGLYTAWMQMPTEAGMVEKLILPIVRSNLLKMDYRIIALQKTAPPLSLLMNDHTALVVIIGNQNYAELVQDFNDLKDFKPAAYTNNLHSP